MAKTRSKQASSSQKSTSLSKFIFGAVIGLGLGWLATSASLTTGLITLAVLLVAAAGAFYVTQARRTRRVKAGTALGALVFGVMAVAGVQYLGSSLAWHPKGSIVKTVQNVTTGGAPADANDAATAVQVKPGDMINYAITVSNIAPNAKKQYNDLAFVTITDTLPDGIELVGNPARTFTDNFGTILPGKSVTKTYQAKVTGTTDGAIQQNSVCFAGDSVVKDNPQKGCDVATTKLAVAATPPPAAPVEPIALPTQLPQTGPSSMVVVAMIAIVTGYLFSTVYKYLDTKQKTMMR